MESTEVSPGPPVPVHAQPPPLSTSECYLVILTLTRWLPNIQPSRPHPVQEEGGRGSASKPLQHASPFLQKAKYLSWKSLSKFLLGSHWSELGHLPELFTNRWVWKPEVVSGFGVTISLLSSNSASHLLVSVSEIRPRYLSFYWLEGVWPPVQALPLSSLKTWEWVRPGKGQQKGPFLLKFIFFWKVTPLEAVLV